MTDTTQEIRKRTRLMHLIRSIIKWAWLSMTIVASAFTILSAFGGVINPETFTLPALMAMGFPIMIILNSLFGIINLFVNKWVSIAQWAAMIICIPAIFNWFPVHLFHHPDIPRDENDIIRFMSYNTFGFVDDEKCYPDSTNRTATAIINSGADIICLQEVGMLTDMPTRSLFDNQIDSINEVYPYFASEEEKMVSILSKYPLREIALDQPVNPHAGWQAAEIVVNSDTILVVSVHLQSFGLNDEDKLIYHNLTNGEMSSNVTVAGMIIYNKLTDAMKSRAMQARKLCAQLDSLNYKNVILSGDFNDIAGCYAIRRLRRQGRMKSVFKSIATGPVITYHSDRFLFNIDHTLYKGNVTPILYRRGNIKSSDHYPLYITFTLK